MPTYTRSLWLMWLTAVVLAGPVAASAQGAGVAVTIEPTMVKGPATAPVTIVEFSDYQ